MTAVDFTSRMVALLAAMRRERNGAVADEMRFFGAPYGLNLGVSLPTLRRIARAQVPDHAFALYLCSQDVRELRLAAFHIAEPERLSAEELPRWGAAIVNSEAAEEAAFGLLSRAAVFSSLFDEWTFSENPLLVYAALMGAARLTAQGAAALLTAIGSRDEKNRQAAIRAAGSGGDTPAERYLRDELAWRL